MKRTAKKIIRCKSGRECNPARAKTFIKPLPHSLGSLDDIGISKSRERKRPGEKIVKVRIVMQVIELDLSPFKKAAASLKKAIQKYQSNSQDEYVRDACIQRFEYTYELCGKFLRRYLEITEQNPEEVKTLAFPDIIRLGNQRNLLRTDWATWKIYREKRNITAHTYDELKAKEIIAILPDFLEEAEFFLTKLEKIIDGTKNTG